MKRITALMVSVIVLLTACSSGSPEPTDAPTVPVTAAPVDGLTVRAEVKGWEVSFYLDGYQSKTPPSLTATSVTGRAFADGVRAPVNRIGANFRLNLAAERNLAADLITYTFETPEGERLTGEFIFSSPSADLPWQVTKTDQFILFHVAPLDQGEAEAYEAAYGRLVEQSGQRAEPGSVVYLFPDQDSLLKFGESLGKRPSWAGFANKDRTYLRGDLPVAEKAQVLARELVHVLGASSATTWIAEGLADYFSLQEMKLQAGAGLLSERRGQFRDHLKALHALAHGGWQVNLVEVPGQDAHTVGVAFMVFLWSRDGHEGVQRLLATLRAGELKSFDAVEAVMGADMETIQREFQGYLESGQMLEDAQDLFGL